MLRISKEGYMAHAVPLVFDANLFQKSTNILLCAMSRLDLVTFQFSVGCRCAIGIVTKWCDFPPCDVTFLHLAIPLGDVTFLRVMWLKPGVSIIRFPKCHDVRLASTGSAVLVRSWRKTRRWQIVCAQDWDNCERNKSVGQAMQCLCFLKTRHWT